MPDLRTYLKQMITDFKAGIICVCPCCGKVDIDPRTHAKVCAGPYEQLQRELEDDSNY